MESHLLLKKDNFGLLQMFVIMVGLFIVVPLIIVIIVSFTPAEFLRLPEGRWSLKWYKEIFNQPEFIEAFCWRLSRLPSQQ